MGAENTGLAARPGRPTKWNQELEDMIVSLLRGGNYMSVACSAVGIDQTTFSRWMRLGEKGREPYRGFRLRVKQAEQVAEVALVGVIRDAAQGELTPLLKADGAAVLDKDGEPIMYRKGSQWQAAARLLESRYRERWLREARPEEKEEDTGKKGVPFLIQLVPSDRAVMPDFSSPPAENTAAKKVAEATTNGHQAGRPEA